MTSVDVLILGGGLAGLSTAYHLERSRPGLRVLVAEKGSTPGGRAGSIERDGFLFDHTGHFLHLHDRYGKALIGRLLRGNLARHERSSWIFSHGVHTRYPFQANTYGLPPAAAAECVAGFARNLYRPVKLPKDPSFEEWSLAAFGEGICRQFMFPYNRKLYRTPLSRLTTDWQGRFLPRPSAAEVLYGALFDQKKYFGYNATFHYPVRGGCQALPDAFAREVPGLRLDSPCLSVSIPDKVAVIRGLGEVRYRRLVNTLPLSDFLDLAGELPRPVKEARGELRWVSVYNLNLGVKRRVSDKHWIYFPEKRFPFYRVGFASNCSRHVAPPGASSMYIEVSRPPARRVDLGRLERQCLEGLRACGLLKASERLAARLWIPIQCAYVIYDRQRAPALRRIMPFLKSRGVESIGRWGAWKYSFMEETILDGRDCARRLRG